MKIKHCTVIFFTFIIFVFAVFFITNAAAIDASSLSAHSAVLIDASNGKILFSKNENERLPMASTTKIMTAVIALENSELSKSVTISSDAVGVEGSSVYLTEGEILTMEDLLYALLLSSANDAATAIALEVGGSIDGFARLMNEKASELGLVDTHFENPHGLDGDEHYTSASDLAILSSYALKNADFKKIVSTYKATIPSSGGGSRLLINHNKLLRIYNGTIGIKTGFTKKSGRCLVSAAERDGLCLVAVTMNAPDDWQDHMSMLDYGFSAFQCLSILPRFTFTTSLPVTGGGEQSVICTNSEPIVATMPIDATADDCIFKVISSPFLYAPVAGGMDIGELVCEYKGEVIGTSRLITSYAVDTVKVKLGLWDKFIGFIKNIF